MIQGVVARGLYTDWHHPSVKLSSTLPCSKQVSSVWNVTKNHGVCLLFQRPFYIDYCNLFLQKQIDILRIHTRCHPLPLKVNDPSWQSPPECIVTVILGEKDHKSVAKDSIGWRADVLKLNAHLCRLLYNRAKLTLKQYLSIFAKNFKSSKTIKGGGKPGLSSEEGADHWLMVNALNIRVLAPHKQDEQAATAHWGL